MRIPKRYGQSRVDNCPFCGKQCVTKNSQGIPVCAEHKNIELKDLKCSCGGWLDVKSGKFGSYFHCLNCGNISFSKGVEMNPQLQSTPTEEKDSSEPKKTSQPTETTVTSDELDFM